ncbi:MBL fold metallo-hydrolase [Roseibium aggregatum]|uniref:MBL fold metallo-hydrolase n=1 Tax=Roseibium aggregatum TaxID=187304 RepID=A0A926P262_9HYPH|nr:MBL fold metallo-hydrolase [Roseibium aggregatum]MBD1547678.1 MBL fold metallo-hydrolase [Roseibium aggregatum]
MTACCHGKKGLRLKHERTFDPAYGTAVEVSDGIRRLTCRNPSPFTFHGTNTYLIGQREIAVLDPGPSSEAHIDDIVKAAGPDAVRAILVSHTHMDHSPGARLLQARTGAPIVGCGPHRAARTLASGEINPMDASADADHVPDEELKAGDTFSVGKTVFEAVETPGHTANHLCFAVAGSNLLFSADHVMAWSTSIVAPPDGNMRDYMMSLERLLQRPESIYLPGHGGVLRDAHGYVEELRAHRLGRERSILDRLTDAPVSIPDLVLQIYDDLPPGLRPAAALSVFAHLEDLAERGLVSAEPNVTLTASYRRPS